MFTHTKKNNFCLNCGKGGHEQKQCNEPITSWGIILVKSDNKLHHDSIDIKKYNDIDGIKIVNKNDLNVVLNNIYNIKFLLVQRKHSLGFSEFVRGKYIVGNIVGIRWLFNQMVPEEIDLIRNKINYYQNVFNNEELIMERAFDDMWNFFWGKNESVITFNKKEYVDSKGKFMQLKMNEMENNVENNILFYLDTAKPGYPTREWGFPKGRRKWGESNLRCAVREFYEETNISESEINILGNVKPIEEVLIGTNGVKYRHIYYLAELKDNKNVNNKNIECNDEIGNVGFYFYNECMDMIRDYHIEKKNILTCILNYYIQLAKFNIEYDKNEWRAD